VLPGTATEALGHGGLPDLVALMQSALARQQQEDEDDDESEGECESN